MGPTSEQERHFYDRIYAQHLNAPDEALICNRLVLLRNLQDPTQPIYERRHLYNVILDVLLAEPLRGQRVLEYGCGLADWGILLATEGATVTLVDLSPIAIGLALRRARVSGVGGRVCGFARDASDLTCFADGAFDLVFASASVHHTLKYPGSLEELARVIRPAGKLLLAETYGNNRVLNLLRRLRWRVAREPSEAGEGIIIGDREIAQMHRHFSTVTVRPISLTAMAKRLFRGHFTRVAVRDLVSGLYALDRQVLRLCPSLARYCGEVVVIAVR